MISQDMATKAMLWKLSDQTGREQLLTSFFDGTLRIDLTNSPELTCYFKNDGECGEIFSKLCIDEFMGIFSHDDVIVPNTCGDTDSIHNTTYEGRSINLATKMLPFLSDDDKYDLAVFLYERLTNRSEHPIIHSNSVVSPVLLNLLCQLHMAMTKNEHAETLDCVFYREMSDNYLTDKVNPQILVKTAKHITDIFPSQYQMVMEKVMMVYAQQSDRNSSCRIFNDFLTSGFHHRLRRVRLILRRETEVDYAETFAGAMTKRNPFGLPV